jgi:hypothetical protein
MAGLIAPDGASDAFPLAAESSTRNLSGRDKRANVKTITNKIVITLYLPDLLTYALID